MNENIFEKARELANMILETPEGMAYNDAKYVFDGDENAQASLKNYSMFRNAVAQRVNNNEITQEELEAENEKLKTMINELTSNPVINDMFMAEQRLNQLVNNVMNVFNATIQGDECDCGCNGSCGSCSGCH